MITLQLFLGFLQIGLFSFGGGYAAMPLLQEQLVARNGWLSVQEFADLVTIAEMTPGPIAVNAATFVGTKLAELPGALAATAGVILPACILVTCIARLYLKYRNLSILQGILGTLRPAVVAMIASAGVLLPVNAFWDGGAGDACRDKLDDAAAFCRLLAAAAQNKAEPNSDNGTRGSHQCRESCFGRIAGSGKSD